MAEDSIFCGKLTIQSIQTILPNFSAILEDMVEQKTDMALFMHVNENGQISGTIYPTNWLSHHIELLQSKSAFLYSFEADFKFKIPNSTNFLLKACSSAET